MNVKNTAFAMILVAAFAAPAFACDQAPVANASEATASDTSAHAPSFIRKEVKRHYRHVKEKKAAEEANK